MSADLTRTAHAAGPVICPAFDFDEQVVAAISAVMRFDSSVEVTTSRLRVELMFPADEAAESFFRARMTNESENGRGAAGR